MKLILAILIGLLSLTSYGKTVNLDEKEPQRTKKEVLNLIKDVNTTSDFSYAVKGNIALNKVTPWDFVSLKDIPAEKLNDIEKTLLENFDNVAFCFHKKDLIFAYWVKDSLNRIGLVNFKGEILCPPVDGNIRYIDGGINKFSMSPNIKPRHMLAIGETQYSDQNEWCDALTEHYMKMDGVGIGHFCAVRQRIIKFICVGAVLNDRFSQVEEGT